MSTCATAEQASLAFVAEPIQRMWYLTEEADMYGSDWVMMAMVLSLYAALSRWSCGRVLHAMRA